MPAAWVSAAVGVVGAISAADSSRKQGNAQDAATAASQQALALDQQKYNDAKPTIDALNQQAIQSNAQAQVVAAQQAARSQQAWNQNQSASAGVAPTVGLNSLGGQYLSPEQQQELLGLQQYLAKQGQAQPAAAAMAPAAAAQQLAQPGLSSADQSRLQQLLQAQQNPTMVGGSQGGGHWIPSQNDGGGDQWVPDAPTAGTSSFTPAMQSELAQLQQKQQAAAKSTIPTPQPGQGDGGPATSPGLYNGMNADQVQARILQLQQAANQAAQQRETDKAGLITGTAGKYANQVTDLGEQSAQSVLNDSQGLQDQLLAQGQSRNAEIKATAQQRANDFEGKAGTQANAAIATSADAANRQLLRLGGDPNRMAAMGLDTANQQQLARISAGNQIAGYNIASLNSADDAGRAQLYGSQDQAFGIKSAALDAARTARTAAKQTAIGMNFGAAQQADTITGNARDTADAKLNGLAIGAMNSSQGYANTSGNLASGAVQSGTAGVNNLNTGANGGTQAASLVNTGAQGLASASKGYQPINYGGVANGVGQAASSIGSLYQKYTGGSSGAGLDSAARSANNAEGEYPIGLGG